MKIVSFNINGLRARPHQLEALIQRHQPDVIGLQETKVTDELFPREFIESLGYQVHCHGQKGHYGVALLSRQTPLEIQKGFPNDAEDAQRRFIWGRFQNEQGKVITIMNGYFPQGENRIHALKFPAKSRFYTDLHQLLTERFSPQEPLIVMGDFNIAPEDKDIGIGEANAKRWLRTGKCCFLPEERQWMQHLMHWGLQDSFRMLYPDASQNYSWFDYRSRGFDDNPKRGLRIDLVLSSLALGKNIQQAGIDLEMRAMEKPSDHCPVWVQLDF